MAVKQEFAPIAQMTIKVIGGKPKDAVKTEKPVHIGRMFGEVAEVKTKDGKNGEPYTYLIGEFRAVNAEGQGFESNKLFLPGSIQEGLEAQVKTSNGNAVRFAFDIMANPDDKSTVGYKYAIKSLIKTEAHDRLAALTAELEGSVPAAPVTSAKSAKK